MVGRILGVVLAGGLARRMGGGDKGGLDLGGQSLIGEVIRRLRPQCDGLVLNANGDAARFAGLGLQVLGDSIPDYPGPLAGVLAGMDHAAGEGFSHVLSAAADTPFLPLDLAVRLAAEIEIGDGGIGGGGIAICATRQDGRLVRQPTFGLWPVDLRDDLRQALNGGVSKIMAWAEPHGVTLVEFAAAQHDPFFNVNTPEDLEIARRIWRACIAG